MRLPLSVACCRSPPRQIMMMAADTVVTLKQAASPTRLAALAGCGGAAGLAPQHAALVWLRQDLRLTDHEPLTAASASDTQWLLPFFCLDEQDLQQRQLLHLPDGGLGTPALGPHRLRALLQALASLRSDLQALGSDLLFGQGMPERLVAQLVGLAAAPGSAVVSVSLHAHMMPGSAALEDAVAAGFQEAAKAAGLHSSVHWCWDRTLYHPDDLHAAGFGGASTQEEQRQQSPTPERINRDAQRFASLPEVMTQFRKAVQTRVAIRAPLPAPASLPPLPPSLQGRGPLRAPLPTQVLALYVAAGPAGEAALARWEQLAGVRAAGLPRADCEHRDARCAWPFSAGEGAALERLRTFLGRAERQRPAVGGGEEPPIRGYQERRFLASGVDNSAKLSTFLSLGCLSPRTVAAEVAAALEAAEGGAVPLPWREPGPGDDLRCLLMHLGIRDWHIFMALRDSDGEPRGRGPWREGLQRLHPLLVPGLPSSLHMRLTVLLLCCSAGAARGLPAEQCQPNAASVARRWCCAAALGVRYHGPAVCGRLHARAGRHWLDVQPQPAERGLPAGQGQPRHKTWGLQPTGSLSTPP